MPQLSCYTVVVLRLSVSCVSASPPILRLGFWVPHTSPLPRPYPQSHPSPHSYGLPHPHHRGGPVEGAAGGLGARGGGAGGGRVGTDRDGTGGGAGGGGGADKGAGGTEGGAEGASPGAIERAGRPVRGVSTAGRTRLRPDAHGAPSRQGEPGRPSLRRGARAPKFQGRGRAPVSPKSQTRGWGRPEEPRSSRSCGGSGAPKFRSSGRGGDSAKDSQSSALGVSGMCLRSSRPGAGVGARVP